MPNLWRSEMVDYGQFCPVAKATELIGERWTLLILRELVLGTHRFSDFQRALSRISPSLLSKRLKVLEEAGIIVTKTQQGRRGRQYFLTPAGKQLSPIIEHLAVWGMRWARGQLTEDELDIFSKSIKLLELNSRPINILTTLFLTLLNRKKLT